MKVAREQFDQALVKDLAFYRSNGRTGKEWWTARPEVAKLLLPIDSIHEVMDQQGPALEILPDLDAVAKSSHVSQKMVWRAQRDAHLQKHTRLVEDAMHKLQGQDVTEESVKQCRSSFLANCHTLGIVASEAHRPKERVFLGVTVSMPVTTPRS